MIADFTTAAGADRVLTIDLHAGQIQGFFNIPLDELTAMPILVQYFKDRRLSNLVVTATDVGAGKRARDMARFLDAPISVIEKQRQGNKDSVKVVNLIGDVSGKTALIVDDEIDTGGTVLAAAEALHEHGASRIYCCVTHPVLSGKANNLLNSDLIEEIIVTDTLPVSKKNSVPKLKILSVSELLGDAIHRIHSGLSVGAMFDR